MEMGVYLHCGGGDDDNDGDDADFLKTEVSWNMMLWRLLSGSRRFEKTGALISRGRFCFLGAFTGLRKATIPSSRLSVCPSAWKNSAPTGRIFIKIVIPRYFEYLSRKFKFHNNPRTTTGTLHEDLYIYHHHHHHHHQ
jgi:hypothetical protein